MILPWLYFVVLIVVMYICIAIIGKVTGGSADSVLGSVKLLFTPLVIFLIFLANTLFAIGIYFGFIVSNNALPISIAIGVVTSYMYSVVTLGVSVTTAKLLGVFLVIIGIYLLK